MAGSSTGARESCEVLQRESNGIDHGGTVPHSDVAGITPSARKYEGVAASARCLALMTVTLPEHASNTMGGASPPMPKCRVSFTAAANTDATPASNACTSGQAAGAGFTGNGGPPPRCVGAVELRAVWRCLPCAGCPPRSRLAQGQRHAQTPPPQAASAAAMESL